MTARDGGPASHPRRIAIVHEWLVDYSGSERVLEQLLLLYPEAELFSVVDFVPAAERGFLGDRRPRTTFVQRLPFARRRYRAYLPLMPLAVEQLDLTGFDLVLSSSHAVAKGVLVGPDALHVCYCHSPLRYAWDLQHEYLAQGGLAGGLGGAVARWLLHRLRLWDVRSAAGVDVFVANSRFIARRIRRAYRRDAAVVHPPVAVERFTPGNGEPGDYYLAASRLVPYKRLDLVVEAFAALPDRQLVVIGDGPQMPQLRRLAGPNVRLLGWQPDDALQRWMRGARAFVFAAVEDFGIAPIEAQAAGVPVIAYAGGALRETVPGLDAPAPCGVHFDAQTADGVRAGIHAFEAHRARITADQCRANALRFAPEVFRREFAGLVAREWAAFVRDRDGHGAER